MKYERAMADLDFAKRRLLEQHEEDLEQTMVLKKQLEKKVRAIKIVTGWIWFVTRETREPQPLRYRPTFKRRLFLRSTNWGYIINSNTINA